MLVGEASRLYDVLVGGEQSEALWQRLADEPVEAAPHLRDAEILSLIRRDFLRGTLDRTAGDQAVEDLIDWPGVRYPHAPLVRRAWELRHAIRTWDALYVALRRALGASLLMLDRRLAKVKGSGCKVEVVSREYCETARLNSGTGAAGVGAYRQKSLAVSTPSPWRDVPRSCYANYCIRREARDAGQDHRSCNSYEVC